jgi:hypothetical protein
VTRKKKEKFGEHLCSTCNNCILRKNSNGRSARICGNGGKEADYFSLRSEEFSAKTREEQRTQNTALSTSRIYAVTGSLAQFLDTNTVYDWSEKQKAPLEVTVI